MPAAPRAPGWPTARRTWSACWRASTRAMAQAADDVRRPGRALPLHRLDHLRSSPIARACWEGPSESRWCLGPLLLPSRLRHTDRPTRRPETELLPEGRHDHIFESWSNGVEQALLGRNRLRFGRLVGSIDARFVLQGPIERIAAQAQATKPLKIHGHGHGPIHKLGHRASAVYHRAIRPRLHPATKRVGVIGIPAHGVSMGASIGAVGSPDGSRYRTRNCSSHAKSPSQPSRLSTTWPVGSTTTVAGSPGASRSVASGPDHPTTQPAAGSPRRFRPCSRVPLRPRPPRPTARSPAPRGAHEAHEGAQAASGTDHTTRPRARPPAIQSAPTTPGRRAAA